MANTKSAQKRIKINRRNRLQNKYYKTSVRNLTKLFFQTLEQKDSSQTVEDDLKKMRSSIYSLLDKGTKNNVFHKNAAARKKAKLAAFLKSNFN